MTLHSALRSSLALQLVACQSLLSLEEYSFEARGSVDASMVGGERGGADAGGASISGGAGGASAGASNVEGAGGSGPTHPLDEGGAGGDLSAGQGALGGTGGGDPIVSLDAGPPEPLDASDGCVPTTLYRDGDGDTYGDVSQQRIDCLEPGWATRSGDCRDDEPLVHEGQAGFFGVGYPDPGIPGGLSFDYDCSGGEDADPTNAPANGAPLCQPLICQGTGYVSVDGREGPGVNPLCGSRVRRDCVVISILGCGASDTPLPEDSAFRCR